jgi:hypothetical protein
MYVCAWMVWCGPILLGTAHVVHGLEGGQQPSMHGSRSAGCVLLQGSQPETRRQGEASYFSRRVELLRCSSVVRTFARSVEQGGTVAHALSFPHKGGGEAGLGPSGQGYQPLASVRPGQICKSHTPMIIPAAETTICMARLIRPGSCRACPRGAYSLQKRSIICTQDGPLQELEARLVSKNITTVYEGDTTESTSWRLALCQTTDGPAGEHRRCVMPKAGGQRCCTHMQAGIYLLSRTTYRPFPFNAIYAICVRWHTSCIDIGLVAVYGMAVADRQTSR